MTRHKGEREKVQAYNAKEEEEEHRGIQFEGNAASSTPPASKPYRNDRAPADNRPHTLTHAALQRLTAHWCVVCVITRPASFPPLCGRPSSCSERQSAIGKTRRKLQSTQLVALYISFEILHDSSTLERITSHSKDFVHDIS